MDKRKTIYIGSDHAGFDLKNEIFEYLKKAGYKVKDLGNKVYEKGDDYPDFAFKVAKKVAGKDTMGILFCGSGVGVCISANKVRGIRAVNASNIKLAEVSRKHNDSNILCLGQDFVGPELSKEIIDVWLNTPFSGINRHKGRVEKIQIFERGISE